MVDDDESRERRPETPPPRKRGQPPSPLTLEELALQVIQKQAAPITKAKAPDRQVAERSKPVRDEGRRRPPRTVAGGLAADARGIVNDVDAQARRETKG